MTIAQTRSDRPIPEDRTIALVGMMGAGKSAIGRQLAQRLGLPFVDADQEIERAAGCTIAEIFEQHGEAHFRDGERRVIARLLDGPACVLATGGGAFIEEETRALLQEKAVTVWLNADFDVLWERVSRRSHRPLLRTADPQRTLKGLIEARYPVYAQAQLTVASDRLPKEATAQRVLDALAAHFGTAVCEEDRR
jgi:shikimate kinase